MESVITELNIEQALRDVIMRELKSLIYEHQGASFIKFVQIALVIEYLGACLDEFPFEKEGESERRFNKALKKLFSRGYQKFAKSSSSIYFYKDFRCAFIHQLRPGKNIVVTHREESKMEMTKHLGQIDSGETVLVLEDFFDDLENAANLLIRELKSGRITNKKKDKAFLKLVSLKSS